MEPSHFPENSRHGITLATTEKRQGPKCSTSLPARTFHLITLKTNQSSPREPAVAFLRPQSAVFRLRRDPGSENPLSSVSGKVPGLVVPRDSGAFRWWSSLKTLATRVKLPASRFTNYPFRGRIALRGYFRGRSLTASLSFHLAAILLIVYLHQAFPESVDAFDSPVPQPEVIYYRVPVQKLPKTLPHIAPAGPGGHPLNGLVRERAPAPGSSASRGVLTIVSKPAHPDNFHQTIIQPSSPPELKITADLKLPNIILGKPIEAPKAPLQFNPSAAKPMQRDRQTNAEPAPSPTQENSADPVMTLLAPPTFKPSLPVPVSQGGALRRNSSSNGNVQAPNVSTAASGDSATLAVISTDPGATSMSQIMLPPGNRSGEFSTSASDNLAGSPGGSRTGVTGGGSGVPGKGGDGSSGVGPASSGGGGLSMSEAPVNISGSGTNAGISGMLGAALARGVIYPVPAVFNVRRNSLTVVTGSIGGGGLGAYGALLHCGKIYTIFLPMPGKNWVMQYCAQNSADAPSAPSSATVAHFGEGVVPPQAESKFDFERIPVPPEKVGKLIILKGVLRTDGFIDELQVYQSVLSEMDDNARLAFSQWKFKPALRESKPIPVQVLVGIPAELPAQAPQ